MKLQSLLIAIKQPYHFLQGLFAWIVFGAWRKHIRIIGVTGTDGKTTTSTMIYHILSKAGKKVALISTVAAYIGDQEIDTGFHVTTPSPFALQRLLRSVAERGYEYVVLEATSHGIHQHRLFGINPEVVVLTNITREHLDYHSTYEHYLSTKASFIARAKTAILNKNDRSEALVKKKLQDKNLKIISYDNKTCDSSIRAALVRYIAEPYNRENGLAAITACQCLHIGTDVCIKAIQSFPGVKGRMEEIPNNLGITVVVDFAHTPNALERALTTLRSRVKQGNAFIAVFGCAGLRDQSKRPAMGRIASERADSAVFTAEDPRVEDVHVIIRQMKEGVVKNWGNIYEIAERGKAIRFAIQTLAKKGDVVGIFGKGHERSMNLDGKHEVPWSDQEEARTALESRKT
ncbi:MAG: UDP-N-acetylmuramoyl-L-alanyl-D-glutamate--2,6-diaminopimelate ligase [Candidatus Pacebacteria bacterium]|nr:UDP-N-acetylmuramoyl-L-alanyl-D-glutamate--2,6-diaminopimelate ligase [Candidatus Paceibacterota bacterium]